MYSRVDDMCSDIHLMERYLRNVILDKILTLAYKPVYNDYSSVDVQQMHAEHLSLSEC